MKNRKIHSCDERLSGSAFGKHERDVAAVALRGEDAGRDGGGEHQQRADERVDDELERRADAPGFPAPHADEEVEGDQHQVEEDDEQRQILSEQRAQHRRLGEHEGRVEEARALPAAQVRGECRGGEQQRGEADEENVQAVDAELVVDAEFRDPHDVGHVAEPRPGRVVGDVADREAERRERAEQRARAGDAEDGPLERFVAARAAGDARPAQHERQQRAEDAGGGGEPEHDRERRHQLTSAGGSRSSRPRRRG